MSDEYDLASIDYTDKINLTIFYIIKSHYDYDTQFHPIALSSLPMLQSVTIPHKINSLRIQLK